LTAQQSPSELNLFVVNHHLVVHCKNDCPQATAGIIRRTDVTPNQCLVHKLPGCWFCWDNLTDYYAAIGVPDRTPRYLSEQ
jgi:hypothetical protein